MISIWLIKEIFLRQRSVAHWLARSRTRTIAHATSQHAHKQKMLFVGLDPSICHTYLFLGQRVFARSNRSSLSPALVRKESIGFSSGGCIVRWLSWDPESLSAMHMDMNDINCCRQDPSTFACSVSYVCRLDCCAMQWVASHVYSQLGTAAVRKGRQTLRRSGEAKGGYRPQLPPAGVNRVWI